MTNVGAPAPGAPQARKPANWGAILLILGVVVALIGVALMYTGFTSQERLDAIGAARQVSVAQAGSAAPGELVRIGARIGADRPAILPGRDEPAIYGTLRLTARTRERTPSGEVKTRSHTLYSQTFWATGVHLADGGARLPIPDDALRGASIDARATSEPAFFQRTATSASLFGGTARGPNVVEYGSVRASVPGGGEIDGVPKAEKTLLSPDQQVFAVGAISGGALGAPPGGQLLIFAGSEDEARRSLAKAAAWQVPVGIALLVLGGVGAFAGIGLWLLRQS